jgi:hypothetical protein
LADFVALPNAGVNRKNGPLRRKRWRFENTASRNLCRISESHNQWAPRELGRWRLRNAGCGNPRFAVGR